MPIIRVQEIREMSSEARDEKLQELRTELTKIQTMIKAGGAIENFGRLVLRDVVVRNYHAPNDGGAVFNRGTVILHGRTRITSNRAGAGGKGAPTHALPAAIGAGAIFGAT